MSEDRQPKVGDHVMFTDEHATRHNALLSAVHGLNHPAVNLVYMSDDASKFDPYGRQIERRSSVVHRASQSANGMFWQFVEEEQA